jgi:predicted DNA-binding transcriptional regulator AlpA
MTILTPDDLAALLKMPRSAVLRLSKQQDFPPSLTGRKKPRWLEDDVKRWAKSARNAHSAR